MSCVICCEDFDGKDIIPFNCHSCKTIMCTKCCKTTWETNKSTKCPGYQCDVILGRREISTVFSSNYMNGDFTKLRTEILFNSRKPFYQKMSKYIFSEKLLNKIARIDQEIRNYLDNIDEIKLSKIQEYSKVLHNNINILKDFLQDNKECTEYLISPKYTKVREYTKFSKEVFFHTIKFTDYLPDTDNDLIEKKPSKFYGYCPETDCPGILSEKYICLFCETKVCNRCMVSIKGKKCDHECNEETVKTLKTIKKDSKLCPNEGCRVPIYKIEGCYQMFCPQCHILFEWKTLKILKERAHNPHALEWQRRTGQIINGDNGQDCGQLGYVSTFRLINVKIDGKDLTYSLQTLNEKAGCKNILYGLSLFSRFFAHIRGVYLQRIQTGIDDFKYNMMTLDRKYLSKIMTEKSYKISLASKEKENEQLLDLKDAISAFVDSGDYIYTEFAQEINNIDHITIEDYIKFVNEKGKKMLKLFIELFDYVNGLLINVIKNYKRMSYFFVINKNCSFDDSLLLGICKIKNSKIFPENIDIDCRDKRKDIINKICKHYNCTDKNLDVEDYIKFS